MAKKFLRGNFDWSAIGSIAMSAKRENGVCKEISLSLCKRRYIAERRDVAIEPIALQS